MKNIFLIVFSLLVSELVLASSTYQCGYTQQCRIRKDIPHSFDESKDCDDCSDVHYICCQGNWTKGTDCPNRQPITYNCDPDWSNNQITRECADIGNQEHCADKDKGHGYFAEVIFQICNIKRRVNLKCY